MKKEIYIAELPLGKSSRPVIINDDGVDGAKRHGWKVAKYVRVDEPPKHPYDAHEHEHKCDAHLSQNDNDCTCKPVSKLQRRPYVGAEEEVYPEVDHD